VPPELVDRGDMDVGTYRSSRRQRPRTAPRTIAGLLAAATLGLTTGCLPVAAGQGADIQTPGPSGGTPASAQPPPPAPPLPA
jgi:hypothetical protein